jgi:hypothetical protein
LKLTICLLTKGRKQYLEQALESYEKFILTGDVNVVLIDNGSDEESRIILTNWKLKHDKYVTYLRNDINNPSGLTYFWDQLKSSTPEWVINPGDDDILVFDVYKEWLMAIRKNPSLNAFASCAQIINSTGHVTGEVRLPSINGISDQIKMITNSLHQPPFFWPSLFFKFSAVPQPPIKSRFTHDWWIGLHLVLKGQIESTQSIGVKYRVHNNQESFQSSNRRKMFEGYNMLINVINSNEFRNSLKEMNDLEMNDLLASCIETKPLYSHPEYYISLMRELSLNIGKVSKSYDLNNNLSEIYISSSGVYTKKDDLENLYTGLGLDTKNSIGNLALYFSENVCQILYDSKEFFNATASARTCLSCNHSELTSGSIYIDCSNFSTLDKFEICEMILVTINEHLENSGVYQFTVTPFERVLIKFFRKLKQRLPKILRKYQFSLKKFVRSK